MMKLEKCMWYTHYILDNYSMTVSILFWRFPVPKVPLPLIYPLEANKQLWGGEAVVQGFQSRAEKTRRVPHFWVPILKRSVVYSEILDKYIRLVVTDRTLQLINANYGFDHYILKVKHILLIIVIFAITRVTIILRYDKNINRIHTFLLKLVFFPFYVFETKTNTAMLMLLRRAV